MIKGLRSEQSVFGLYSSMQKKILIAEDQTKEEAISTLVHESIHALFDRAGVNQSINGEIEEVIAEQVAIMITENFSLTLKKSK